MEDRRIVCFSGGKDSTAMLLILLEESISFDEVVYFDCGSWEFPQMRDHIKKVEEYTGVIITKLRAELSFEYFFWQHWPKGKHKQPYMGRSWPSPIRRWCTGIKTTILDKYCGASLRYIGFAYDERHRAIRGNIKKLKVSPEFPLIDRKIDEQQALEYCYKKGFYWSGLYEHFKRVSCWLCPLQSLGSLRNLYLYYPELWLRLKMIDKNTWQQFRKDYSVEQLERKFIREQELVSLKAFE